MLSNYPVKGLRFDLTISYCLTPKVLWTTRMAKKVLHHHMSKENSCAQTKIKIV